MQRNYDQGIESLKRALAARGGLQSGELGYGLDQADTARSASEYDLANDYMSSANQAVGSYLGVESSERKAQAEALRAAEQAVYSNPLNRPVAGTEGTLDPNWQTKYGIPVYSGPDGKLYTLDGNGNPVPYTPKPTDPPPTPGDPPPGTPPATPTTNPPETPYGNYPAPTNPTYGQYPAPATPTFSPFGTAPGPTYLAPQNVSSTFGQYPTPTDPASLLSAALNRARDSRLGF